MTYTPTGYKAIEETLLEHEEGYRVPIPDGWRQGRTAYGGIMGGLSLACAMRDYADLPSLRSATINFIGPVTHDPHFLTTLLRQGRNVTSVEVRAQAKDTVCTTSTFVFGAARDSHLTVGHVAPETNAPDSYDLFTPPAFEPYVPKFFLNFETRLIAGSRPLSGAKDGYIRTWSRHKDPASRTGITSLLTLSDVLPPAAMPLLTKMGPVSSVNFVLNTLVDNPTTEDGWWHVETKLTAASGGYSSQIMRFWNTDGILVAEGLQAVAIFV